MLGFGVAGSADVRCCVLGKSVPHRSWCVREAAKTGAWSGQGATDFRGRESNSGLGFTHRPLSSSLLLGLPYRILNINHKKEPLRGRWVEIGYGLGFLFSGFHRLAEPQSSATVRRVTE